MPERQGVVAAGQAQRLGYGGVARFLLGITVTYSTRRKVGQAPGCGDLSGHQAEGRAEGSAEARGAPPLHRNTLANFRNGALIVSWASTILWQKTKVEFGGEVLLLSELSNVATMLHGTLSPVASGPQKAGRNDPFPCWISRSAPDLRGKSHER